MTILRRALAGLAILIVLVVVTVLIVIRTGWFRSYVRAKVIAAIEDATGGRAEVGAFAFTESNMTATVDGLVIHGTEPADASPFLSVHQVTVKIGFLRGLKHLVGISSLIVDQPQVNIVVLADGRSNIPTPRNAQPSTGPPLKPVVDLAIGHFALNRGFVAFDERRTPLNVQMSNLEARLTYNTFAQTYQGTIAFAPVYVVSGRNTPLAVEARLPLVFGSDRIELHRATVSTAASTFALDGSVRNLRNPEVAGRVSARVALADLRTAGLIKTSPWSPANIRLAADVSNSNGTTQINSMHADFSASSIDAAGNLQGVQFHSTLALGELARVFNIGNILSGTMTASGTARLDANNNCAATASIQAMGLALQSGTTTIRNVNLTARIQADPKAIDLGNVVVNALGGQFAGKASLHDMRNYRVDGTLRNFDIRTTLASFRVNVPYDGAITGVVSASGDTVSTQSLSAAARLTVTPGKRGIPVAGKIDARYTAQAGDLTLANSYLTLPHSRIEMNGALQRSLNLAVQTQDLNDFLAAAKVTGEAVKLNKGQINFTGAVTGGLSAPRISGHLAASRILVEGRQFDSGAADLAAFAGGAQISNGTITRAGAANGMRARFSATLGLANWKLPPSEPIQADFAIDQADLADLAALAGENAAGYSGAVIAQAHVTGTAGNPLGAVSAQASQGTIAGQPFDETKLQVNLQDRLVTIPSAYIQSPAGRVDLSGEYRHPADSFTTGHLRAHVTSTSLNLAKSLPQISIRLTGTVQTNLDAEADITTTGAMVSSVNGTVTGRELNVAGQAYGALDISLQTAGRTVSYTARLTPPSSKLQIAGSTQLAKDYPTAIAATLTDLSVEKLLATAEQSNISATGNLSGTIHLSGTLQNPQGDANLQLTRAVLYDEPIDRVQLQATYFPGNIAVTQLEVDAGSSHVRASGHYDHPVGSLQTGNAAFSIESNSIDLSKIRNVQNRRPGLAGILQIEAKGSGVIQTGNPRLTLRELTLNAGATGIRAAGETFGDLKLTANTSGAGVVSMALDSNLAGARIQGHGTTQLKEGYPVNAALTFDNVMYSHVARLLGVTTDNSRGVEAVAAGQLSIDGPILHTDQLRAGLQVTKLTATANARPGQSQPVSISNNGPIGIALDRGIARIQSAHISGSGADLSATGTASITGGPLALAVNGNVNLGILQNFDADLFSSGSITLNAAVRGTLSQPIANGQVALRDASLSYAGLPNGISKANGTILLTGNTASIQNLTAESGGGTISVTGFAGYGDVIRFGVQLKASRVRARVQPGVSVVAGANVQLSGTSRRSVISGTAVIDQITYNPQTDIAAILSKASPTVQSASAPSALLENMRLDIRVRTAAGLSVRAGIAEGISATADIRIQGTAAQPGVLGRVIIDEGKLVFLGSSFTVDTGTIAFYNPLLIEPVLDVSLETQSQGVQVILHVTGTIDNMKLNYTSNPPLEFDEILALLATGKTPTTDPTLLANQPTTPQASLPQVGESALLGSAVANPLSGRLQRVFGVSQLKIDPSFQGGSELPTARLTLQQRITSNVTFTYTSALDDPNGQIIKVEWAFDPKWSAAATRDQNGIFSVNFFYKRQFR